MTNVLVYQLKAALPTYGRHFQINVSRIRNNAKIRGALITTLKVLHHYSNFIIQ